MRPFSKVFLDSGKVISASTIQFFLTLVSTPLMTRLYEPAAYAAFGMVNTAATTLIGIGFLSLPNAYPLENEPKAKKDIMQTLCLLLLLLVTFALAVTVLEMATGLFRHTLEIPIIAFAVFPVLVFTCGLRQIALSMATSDARFGKMAKGQMLEPLCSRGGSIALGWLLSGNPVYILLSVAAGQVLVVTTIIGRNAAQFWQLVRQHRPQKMMRNLRHTLRKNREFVWFSTPSQQMQPLVMLLVQVALAAFYSSALAGHYILANSILTLPSVLIGLATAPVLYRHCIELARNAPEKLAKHYFASMLLYLLAGLVFSVPLVLYGAPIFRLLFGENWGHAGVIASALAPLYVTTMMLIGVQFIFRVTQSLKLQFVLEMLLSPIALGCSLMCFAFLAFDSAMFYFAMIWLVRNVLLLAACVTVVLNFTKKKAHSKKVST